MWIGGGIPRILAQKVDVTIRYKSGFLPFLFGNSTFNISVTIAVLAGR